MKKMGIGSIIRQGDVFIERINSLPSGKRKLLNEKTGEAILAHGEATGHKHQIKQKVNFYEIETSENMFERFLEVIADDATLIHDEHYPVPSSILEKGGFYKINLPREYSPEEIKRVID